MFKCMFKFKWGECGALLLTSEAVHSADLHVLR